MSHENGTGLEESWEASLRREDSDMFRSFVTAFR